jgi:hypothetical protein
VATLEDVWGVGDIYCPSLDRAEVLIVQAGSPKCTCTEVRQKHSPCVGIIGVIVDQASTKIRPTIKPALHLCLPLVIS